MATKQQLEQEDKVFLDRLVKLAKRYGWSGDYIEVERFVEWVHDEQGLECPDLTPNE